MKRKDEADRIIGMKKDILITSKISYLEYVDIQEEIVRLKNIKNIFEEKLKHFKKLKK